MAVENEYKYLVGTDVMDKFLEKMKGICTTAKNIRQFYFVEEPKVKIINQDGSHFCVVDLSVLGGDLTIPIPISEDDFANLGSEEKSIEKATVRVRHTQTSGGEKYEITVKKFHCGKLVEMETSITSETFTRAITGKGFLLKKTRFPLEHDGLVFEVDFFFSEELSIDKPCLCIIEVEVAEGAPRPKLPKYMENYVVKYIYQTSAKYTNAFMANMAVVYRNAMNDTDAYRRSNG